MYPAGPNPQITWHAQTSAVNSTSIPGNGSPVDETISRAVTRVKESGDLHSLKILEGFAQQGNCRAQYHLGEIFVKGCNGISQELACAKTYFLQCIGNPYVRGMDLPLIPNFSNSVDKKYLAAALNDLGCIFYNEWFPSCKEHPSIAFNKLRTVEEFFNQAIQLQNKISEVNKEIINYRNEENLVYRDLMFSCANGVEAGKLTSSECNVILKIYDFVATDLEKEFKSFEATDLEITSKKSMHLLFIFNQAKQYYQKVERLLQYPCIAPDDETLQIKIKTEKICQKLSDIKKKAIRFMATEGYKRLSLSVGEENIEVISRASIKDSIVFLYSGAFYDYGVMCMEGDGVPVNRISAGGALDFFKAFLKSFTSRNLEIIRDVLSAHLRMGEIYCQAYGPYQLQTALKHFEEAKRTHQHLVASNFYDWISSGDEEKTKANDGGFSESELLTKIKDVQNSIKTQEECIKPFRTKIQECRETITALQTSKPLFGDNKKKIKMQTQQLEVQLILAYQHGDSNAVVELAEMYEENNNQPEAAKWYGIAVEIGFSGVRGKCKEVISESEKYLKTHKQDIETSLERKMAQQFAEQKQRVKNQKAEQKRQTE